MRDGTVRQNRIMNCNECVLRHVDRSKFGNADGGLRYRGLRKAPQCPKAKQAVKVGKASQVVFLASSHSVNLHDSQ